MKLRRRALALVVGCIVVSTPHAYNPVPLPLDVPLVRHDWPSYPDTISGSSTEARVDYVKQIPDLTWQELQVLRFDLEFFSVAAGAGAHIAIGARGFVETMPATINNCDDYALSTSDLCGHWVGAGVAISPTDIAIENFHSKPPNSAPGCTDPAGECSYAFGHVPIKLETDVVYEMEIVVGVANVVWNLYRDNVLQASSDCLDYYGSCFETRFVSEDTHPTQTVVRNHRRHSDVFIANVQDANGAAMAWQISNLEIGVEPRPSR